MRPASADRKGSKPAASPIPDPPAAKAPAPRRGARPEFEPITIELSLPTLLAIAVIAILLFMLVSLNARVARLTHAVMMLRGMPSV